MSDAPIYHITFLRHGESVGNAEDRFQGQADFPLTEKGRAQARALAERWAAAGRTFDLCLASPLLRARQTAEIIAGALGVPVEFDPVWMEIHNGKLAGLTDEEAASVAPRPKFMTPYTRFGETGESRLEILLRAGKGIQNLLDRPPARCLVVAHGGILNNALFIAMGMTLHADGQGPRFMFFNTGFADLTYDPERHAWRLWGFDNSGDLPE
ncbi:MAG: 2 3-bisphosphoglycerate-dependent phosphoglycerate mutase [Anaerolineaceae bacterium]|nr:MAG: 2 3-bisphosphoglycerate-dependent phosphoglycerate mutase [Anaerolineaceae bacterium]